MRPYLKIIESSPSPFPFTFPTNPISFLPLVPTQAIFPAIIIFLTSSSQGMFHLDDESGGQQATDPFQSSPPIIPKQQIPKATEDLQLMYYEQYMKIYLTSYKLWLEGRKQEAKHRLVSDKLAQIEAQLTAFYRRKRAEDIEEELQMPLKVEKKRSYKRNRRTAQEIERKFQCPYEFCDRCYGSDGSLQQHLKLKHPELYRSISEDSFD